MSQAVRVDDSAAARRGRFFAPEEAFDRPIPRVPPAVFRDQRDRAFDPAAPTGFIACDQSEAIDSPWAATTPTLLARYGVIRPGEMLDHAFVSTGEVFYVIRGSGTTQCAGETFDWKQGDAFCLPGCSRVVHRAEAHAIVIQVTNEPELAYLRANGSSPDIAPTLFRSEESEAYLRAVHGRNGEQRSAGKSVIFLTDAMAERRLTTPTMLAAINTLEPGGDQRPHRHSSVALTLSIAGEGVYSSVDGTRVDWHPDTLFVTPPNAVHSHHNRGPTMMRSFVVQDTGLHTQLRTTNFGWTE